MWYPRVMTLASGLTELVQRYADVSRQFEYDYIFLDAGVLVLWVCLLLRLRAHRAILFGCIVAPLIFAIDAGIWWNRPVGVGADGATTQFMREYWIGGVAVEHPAGPLALRKFGADFMMTISYAMFAFPWLWLSFGWVRRRRLRPVALLTGAWLACWSLPPLLSPLVPLDDTSVRTVRHMAGAYPGWIIATVVGYVLAFIVYRREPRIPVALLGLGALGALVMEIPLHLSGIRPPDPGFIVFEMLVLLNQAVPFLYILFDKVICREQRESSVGAAA